MAGSRANGRWIFCLGLSVALGACAEGGDLEGVEGMEPGDQIRPDEDVDRRPVRDGGGAGEVDAGTTQADAGGDEDCPLSACTVGATRCEGALLNACIEDPSNPGCGKWSTATTCPSPQQTCIEGNCELPEGCVDEDGDGYGPLCEAGPDCDDADAQTHPGASELCDGRDNDCDAESDEDFGVGMSCTIGSGACEATGTTACGPDGSVICQTGTAQGTAELCDGEDNDCDGQIDEDGACDFCAGDPYEANDSAATATVPTLNQPAWAYSCPADPDFLSLPVTGGNTYRIYVTAPRAIANLDVRLYKDGTLVNTSASTTSDLDGFTLRPPEGSAYSYVAEIVNNDGVAVPYRVAFVDTWACAAEDGFTPNDTRDSAAYLLPDWRTRAAVCAGMSDWYDMETLEAGTNLTIRIHELSSFSGDLDLYLWGDPDGDGTWDELESSEGFFTDELITYSITTTGRYYFEVYDYDGIGDDYEVEYSVQ